MRVLRQFWIFRLVPLAGLAWFLPGRMVLALIVLLTLILAKAITD